MATGDWEATSGNAAFSQILDADPDVDGLFAASDQMALGALHVANTRGIRIPEQLAVVGFDGLPEAAEFTPSLTTMYQPLKEIGRLAVQELVASLSADPGQAATSIVVPTQMLLGDSASMPGAGTVAGSAAPGSEAGAAKAARGERCPPRPPEAARYPSRAAASTQHATTRSRLQPLVGRAAADRPRGDLQAGRAGARHRRRGDRAPLDRHAAAPEADRERQRGPGRGPPR